MLTRVMHVLKQAGVPAEDVEALTSLVMKPPPGSIDPTEFSGAEDDWHLALFIAIVAATNIRRFGQALQALLAFAAAAHEAFSDYDSGRFWHLKGLAAWRFEKHLYRPICALNRSVALLAGCRSLQTQDYLARVFDTFGQLLQHQGLLHEARYEFEQILAARTAGNRLGQAWTLGSLGRLCMELGDFVAAASYLDRDLAIAKQLSPDQTRVHAQLLSHLGTCAVEQKEVQKAQAYFEASARLAQADNDAHGLAFASVGLGRVAFLRQDLAQAQEHAAAAERHITFSGVPLDDQEGICIGIRGLIYQLNGEIALKHGEARQAVEAFELANGYFSQTPRFSVVEQAYLRYGYAQARLANGEPQHAAHLLRQALQFLDASTAEALRREIEEMLRTSFRESWLLHSTSRFIGRQDMDFVLEHAGGNEFRGVRQDVVILFCDLRDFTSLTEQFAAKPEAFVTILNDYLRHMTRCIEHYGGLVCQFNGDGVMAVFSLPVPKPADDAERAVFAALLMQEELTRFCRTLQQEVPRLNIGIGLHAGPVIAGLFGSPQKRLYTVNGDAANTAARIEGLTKHLGASVLISDAVACRLPASHRFLLRPLGRYRLKGKAQDVEVAEVMGEDDGSRFAQRHKVEIAHVHQAFEYFRRNQFSEAYDAFTALAEEAPQTGNDLWKHGYTFLARKADAYRANPPEVEWSGAMTMEEK